MLNSLHLPSGFEFLTRGPVPMVMAAAAALVIVIALIWFAIRFRHGVAAALFGGALVLLGVLAATGLRWLADDGGLRRSIEARAESLTMRAIAPGSGLACLDAVANAEVETACEKVLFASAESVAAAITYVDARIALLAASAPLAARDPSYQPTFERARRALEADRFGLVAHVLTTRGCTASGCAELALLRDNAHVVANMKALTFDGYVGTHAAAWHLNGNGAMASLPSAAPGALPAGLLPSAGSPAAAGTTTGSARSRFDYPSAASIPAVSIMTPEPPVAESKPETKSAPPKPAPPKRAEAKPSHRQSSHEPPAQTGRAPLSVLPPPPPLPQQPQTSGQR
jgi:hypothetical protein